jgi:hypothetical protein
MPHNTIIFFFLTIPLISKILLLHSHSITFLTFLLSSSNPFLPITFHFPISYISFVLDIQLVLCELWPKILYISHIRGKDFSPLQSVQTDTGAH